MDAKSEENNFWNNHYFQCKDCGHCFKPKLLKDEAGDRVRVVIEKFYPPRNVGGDWSPIAEKKTCYAECPKCKRETNWIIDMPAIKSKAT